MKLASYYGHVPSPKLMQPWDKWPLPKCNIGLEWEFERATGLSMAVPINSGYFSVHEDRSLRDNGMEIVTSGDGLFGQDLIAAIRTLDKIIVDLPLAKKPVCNARTGFHVHIDIRDLEEKELHNMLMLYCLLEKPIFNFVGMERWKSNFCVPWFRSDSQFGVLKQIEALGDTNIDVVASNVKALQRYSALNCQSISKFGTLEFRHMENISGEILTKQVEFIKLIMCLKIAATTLFQHGGLFGSGLFEYCKALSKYDLIRVLGYPLPPDDWDYPETLMQAIGLVNFKPRIRQAWFVDAMFDRFSGKHPNWK